MNELVSVVIDQLQPHPQNPSVGDIESVVASYLKFGELTPIIVWKPDGTQPDEVDESRFVILAGHTRVKAGEHLKLDTMQAIEAQGLDWAKATAFMLADNRTRELATYDEETLAEALQTLYDDTGDLELILATGWDAPVVGGSYDDMIGDLGSGDDDEDDEGGVILNETGRQGDIGSFHNVSFPCTADQRTAITDWLKELARKNDLGTTVESLVFAAESKLGL